MMKMLGGAIEFKMTGKMMGMIETENDQAKTAGIVALSRGAPAVDQQVRELYQHYEDDDIPDHILKLARQFEAACRQQDSSAPGAAGGDRRKK